MQRNLAFACEVMIRTIDGGKVGAGEEDTKPTSSLAMAVPTWLFHVSCHWPGKADDATSHLQVSTGLPRVTASSLVGQTAMPMSGVRKMVSGSQPW